MEQPDNNYLRNKVYQVLFLIMFTLIFIIGYSEYNTQNKESQKQDPFSEYNTQPVTNATPC
jgi:hypothetical protein